jgi:hypothetical protein
MRSRLFIFALLSLILTSCAKDKTVDTKSYVDVPTNLIGSWNWQYSSGGYAGVTITPETTGEVRIIKFDTDNNFRYYVNGVLKSESKFHIEKSVSIYGNKIALILMTDTWPSRQSLQFRASDTLTLSEESFDGFGHHYLRIK